MAKYQDVIDLYDDNGKLLKSNVALEKISPLVNPASSTTPREPSQSTSAVCRKDSRPERSANTSRSSAVNSTLTLSATLMQSKQRSKSTFLLMQTTRQRSRRFNGGKLLLVKVPSARIASAATYDAALTSVAAATTYAVVEQFNVDMFNANTVKAAVFGSYPVTMDMAGGACSMIMSIPQNNESLGYALRRNLRAGRSV